MLQAQDASEGIRLFAQRAESALLRNDGTAASRQEDAESARFEQFFQQHEREIFGYLWRVTGEEQAASDLTQETFVRAWEHFAKVRAYEQPRAWLFRVATNLAINHQRQRSSSAGLLRQIARHDIGADPATGIAERDAVREALLRMPIRQRTALVLRVIYGLSFDELADTRGVSPAAAKMTLSRGREQFRSHYADEHGDLHR